MKQQYILLRTENDLLNSLIGQSFNQRTKFEAEKILKEIHSKARDRSVSKTSLCFVSHKGEIKGVGGSTLLKDKKTGEIVSNLILNNWGVTMSRLFRKTLGVDPTTMGLVPIDGIGGSLQAFGGTAMFNTLGGNKGTLLQIGSGSTAPARTDFKIETPFGTIPESTFIVLGADPLYVGGLGNFKCAGVITAGSSGTVRESVLFGRWNKLGSTREYALFRDSISPELPFTPAQTITLEYTIQL